MSRPVVPHCRECRHFLLYDKKLYAGSYNLGFKCLKDNRYVNYQEAKTSPKWCPLRFGR